MRALSREAGQDKKIELCSSLFWRRYRILSTQSGPILDTQAVLDWDHASEKAVPGTEVAAEQDGRSDRPSQLL
jgi:hypothetical protein